VEFRAGDHRAPMPLDEITVGVAIDAYGVAGSDGLHERHAETDDRAPKAGRQSLQAPVTQLAKLLY